MMLFQLHVLNNLIMLPQCIFSVLVLFLWSTGAHFFRINFILIIVSLDVHMPEVHEINLAIYKNVN